MCVYIYSYIINTVCTYSYVPYVCYYIYLEYLFAKETKHSEGWHVYIYVVIAIDQTRWGIIWLAISYVLLQFHT